MRTLFLGTIFIINLLALPAQARRVQWSLRFNEARAYPSALTGCFGTASYQYVVPKIDAVKEFHQALRSKAAEHQLTGFIWSMSPDPENEGALLAVDIASGEVVSRPQSGGESARGFVFCQCRQVDLRHCNPSGLPALGEPFVANSESSP